jgi:hypothetical protein
MSGSNEKANAKPSQEEFIYVDANEITFVKRGRKSNADPELIEKLKGLPVGKALAIRSMKVDPKADNFRNEKARIGSQIRTACAAANLVGFRILWSPEGVPQVVR